VTLGRLFISLCLEVGRLNPRLIISLVKSAAEQASVVRLSHYIILLRSTIE